MGLQWGWLSLLQQDPLNAPAEATGTGYQHIIILFTDGLNTGDRWYGDFGNQSTQVDTRMKALCDNVKASGVTIYTVQIDTDGAGQSAVLPYCDCASGTSNSFMLTQPSQIATAFSSARRSRSCVSQGDLLCRRKRREVTQKPGRLAGLLEGDFQSSHSQECLGCEW